MSKKAVVISDPQCKPGVDMSYMSAIGNYVAAKRPDYIIHIGDHWDFPSLSSYDKGKRAAEGRRLADDIAAGNKGMDLLLHATKQMQQSQRANKKKVYSPRMIFCAGNHECLTEHSEVLTKEGFKHYKDLLPTDQVLTLTDSMKQEWNTPELVFEKDYKGKLISYESSCFSSLTTPGHRMYYLTSSNNLRVVEAQHLPGTFSAITASSSDDVDVDLTDDEIELGAWLCTDSHHPNKGRVTLYQRDSNSSSIRNLLNRLGIHFSERRRDRDITHICGKKLIKKPEASVEFVINNHCLLDKINVSSNKKLPDWVSDLSDRQWDVFLNKIVEADGSIPTQSKKSLVFYGRKEICDDVQRNAVIHGWSASLTEYRKNQWRVNLCKLTSRRQEKIDKREFDYEGKVWCMKVKNENFFIRHNNKCHFTGNCRLDRMADDFPELHDTLGIEMLNIEQWGWEVYDFLKPAVAEGITFMHYLPNPFTGKPYGGTAMSQLKNVGCSFVVGHKQTLDVAIRPTLDGNMQLGVICGASYDFDEDYKGYTGNTHFRGITVLHEMENGFALPMFVSTQYLKKNYL